MRYFVVSDIHSYFKELVEALVKAEFSFDNKTDKLVIAGDAFDRGEESVALLKLLKDLDNKGKLIYIRGNHEDLLQEMIDNGYVDRHDKSNGTAKTFAHLSKTDYKKLDPLYWHTYYIFETGKDDKNTTDLAIKKTRSTFANAVKKVKPIMNWINKKTINYLEIDDFIIAHAMIPCKRNEVKLDTEFRVDLVENKNWRKSATPRDWYSCRWVNPYSYIRSGYFDPEKNKGKTLIFGHWFACYIKQLDKRLILDNDDDAREYVDDPKNHDAYFGDRFIAIDSCVMRSGKITVLVIEKKGKQKAKIIKTI